MAQRGFDMTVDRKGNPTIEAVGHKGRACIAATQDLLDKLGGEVEVEETSDMYEQETAEEHLREGTDRSI